MGLSEYEREQLDKVNAHKERALSRSPRRLVPAAVQARGASIFGRLQTVPGVDKARDAGAAVFGAAAEGAGKAMTRTGQLTTSDTRVVRAYVKKGHSVEHLDDIRTLDLRSIDNVASFSRLHYAYSLSAAAEGAAAGLAVAGGQAVVVAGGVVGAGAGAAPGLGTIAAAMGVDAAALLTLCSRVVAHDALYYGYDPRDPAEEVFMMQIIGLGLATTAPAKAAAYQQLAVLTRSLATNAAWRQLNQQTFVKVAQKFATQFGQKLTKKKLGQFVPVAGIGLGAALNWKVVSDIADAAYWAYRERFLLGKDGNAAMTVIDVEIAEDAEGAEGFGDTDATIDVLGILKSEGIDLGASNGETRTDTRGADA